MNKGDPGVAGISKSAMRRIASEIHRDFDTHLSLYDEDKYPPKALAAFRTAFRNSNVPAETIRDALKWKYGKHGKDRISPKHEIAIAAFVKAWPRYVNAGGPVERAGFDWWREFSPPVPYISYSFLVHLRSPDLVPIIDQHNYRAVRHYLKESGIELSAVLDVATPRRWEHIALVREFSARVRGAWPSERAPSDEAMDRFLMMRGKVLKQKSGSNPRHRK